MTRWLLAFSLVLALLPVVEVVSPGSLERVIAFFGSSDGPAPPSPETPPGPIAGATSSSPLDLPFPSTGPTAPVTASGSSMPVSEARGSTDSPNSSNDSILDRSPSSDSATGRGEDASTSSASAQRPEVLTGSLSGVVTGVAELAGKVSLVGDLTVDGGLLLAGPGVEVEGNGFQIIVMRGGRLDWEGTAVSIPFPNGEVSLERDVTVNNVSRIIFSGAAGASSIRYVTIKNSGRPELGFYPLHWHLNGDSTRGTLVEGVVVLNGANHAFVPHGSNGISFVDSVARNTIGSAFWWDPPGSNRDGDPDLRCQSLKRNCTLDNSNDIVIERMVIDGVSQAKAPHRVAAFVLGAGKGNVIRASRARNVRGGADCSGFHWPESANLNEGGTAWTFANNTYSGDDCHGIFVWQNDSSHHVIDGFAGGGIDHGAYSNRYDYRNVTVPYLEIHAVGWEMSDSTVGSVIAAPHVAGGKVRFTNVDFQSFVLRDAGSEAATYLLDRTNLSCSDLVYENAHPESRVVIDGRTC